MFGPHQKAEGTPLSFNSERFGQSGPLVLKEHHIWQLCETVKGKRYYLRVYIKLINQIADQTSVSNYMVEVTFSAHQGLQQR